MCFLILKKADFSFAATCIFSRCVYALNIQLSVFFHAKDLVKSTHTQHFIKGYVHWTISGPNVRESYINYNAIESLNNSFRKHVITTFVPAHNIKPILLGVCVCTFCAAERNKFIMCCFFSHFRQINCALFAVFKIIRWILNSLALKNSPKFIDLW